MFFYLLALSCGRNPLHFFANTTAHRFVKRTCYKVQKLSSVDSTHKENAVGNSIISPPTEQRKLLFALFRALL